MPLQSASHLYAMRPAYFSYNGETAITNVFQRPSTDLTQVVQAVFDRMMRNLKAEKIEVFIEQSDDDQAPDSVFPNNWLASLPGGVLLLFPMCHPSRRRERKSVYVERLQKNFKVDQMIDLSSFEEKGCFLEGTGSMVLDHTEKRIYAARSARTHESVLHKLAEQIGYEPLVFTSLNILGQPVYHTNVLMHIGASFGACCFDCIDEADRRRIEVRLREQREWIELSVEQIFEFAGNMLQVLNSEGTPYTLLSQRAYRSLKRDQVRMMEKFTQVFPIDISPVEEAGGGSVRCMLAELFLEKRSNDE